ncbi:DUF3828 domain-containing protein [Limnobaculum zhutongyuii]|uniref:DUF3828 domain-containing protein n=2 Tax=Limnobaculum zhutongyuii TaxID=2498113 RepID=A0A411WN26_9GAMM|nr:DUF3828 domain-containing protein [Limnobaculum zhutongyuii]TQS86764.1 DUF3828 domain-containing protein [Limnobaculum zhutongyuii]
MIMLRKILLLALLLTTPVLWQNTLATEQDVGSAMEKQATPQQQVIAFYHWYMTNIERLPSAEPEDKKTFEQYISQETLNLLNKINNSEDPLDADYYLSAQDYGDNWASEIEVLRESIDGNSAEVDIHLGKTNDMEQTLYISLRLEHGAWKIYRVQDRVTDIDLSAWDTPK